MVKWVLGLLSWLIVGVVAFLRGLDMVGYPVARVQEFMLMHPTWIKPLGLIILLSGAWSLLTMVGMVLGFKGCRGCSCKGACNCGASCPK